MMFCLKSPDSTIVLNPRARNGYYVYFDRDSGEVIIDQKNGQHSCFQITVLRRGWKIQRGPKCTQVMTCFVNTKKVSASSVIGLKQGDVVSFRYSNSQPIQFKYSFYKTQPNEATTKVTATVKKETEQNGLKDDNNIPPNDTPSTPQTSQNLSSINTSQEPTSTISTPTTTQENESDPLNLSSTIRKLKRSINCLENRLTTTPTKDNTNSDNTDEINNLKKQVQIKTETLQNLQKTIKQENPSTKTESKTYKKLKVEDKTVLMTQLEKLKENEVNLKADIKSLEESLLKEKEMYVRISKQKSELEKQYVNLETKLNDETKFKSDIETELTCTICNELFTETVMLNCSHCFCNECIESWRKNKNTVCPNPICDELILTQVKVMTVDNIVKKWLYANGE